MTHPNKHPACCCRAWGGSLAILALLIPASAASGQAVLAGIVREDSTGRPMPGVEVLVEGTKRQSLTDASGRYLLIDLPTGVRVALFRSVGYRPVRHRIRLVTEDTVLADARLVAEGTVLPPIEVTGRPALPRSLREGFEERRRNGTGIFIDSAELRRSEHMRMSDMLRRHNVVVLQMEDPRVKPNLRLIWIVANKRNAGRRGWESPNRPCVTKIVLDGATVYDPQRETMWPTDINMFDVRSLESVEVYRSAAELPNDFAGTGSDCGVIVLWTRRN